MTQLFNKRKQLSTIRAFTLVELMVTLAIVAILSAIVVTNSRDSEGRILLKQAAQDYLMLIKQAQSDAINVATGSSNNTIVSRGVFFDSSNNRASAQMFAERQGSSDGVYNHSSPGLDLKIGSLKELPQELYLKSLCLDYTDRLKKVCNNYSPDELGYQNLFDMNIVFRRPNIQASLNGVDPTDPGYSITCIPGAQRLQFEIARRAKNDERIYVIVYSSGLMYVSQAPEITYDPGNNSCI